MSWMNEPALSKITGNVITVRSRAKTDSGDIVLTEISRMDGAYAALDAAHIPCDLLDDPRQAAAPGASRTGLVGLTDLIRHLATASLDAIIVCKEVEYAKKVRGWGSR